MDAPARTPSTRRSPCRAGAVSALAALALIASALAGCSDTARDPAAERGRQIFLAQCIACHNADPAQPGAVGPPVRGSSRELLEAKLVKGTYPPGYAPKRPTTLMPLQPALAPDIPNLAAFLK